MPERRQLLHQNRPEPPHRLTICERCWTVIAIDGENNEDRLPQICSHLGPFIDAVTT